MNERIFIDATGMIAFYACGQTFFDGTIKVYSKNRPIETIIIESDSDEEPNQKVFDVMEKWGLALEDDDPYAWDPMGCVDFMQISVDETQVTDVNELEWVEIPCKCYCNDEITHKRSPIPPGYGEVFEQQEVLA